MQPRIDMKRVNQNMTLYAQYERQRMERALGLPPSFPGAIGGAAKARNRSVLGGFTSAAKPLGAIPLGGWGGANGSHGSEFARGFVPRWTASGPHMGFCGSTYANRGFPLPPGVTDPRWGPFVLKGRLTGNEYRGCFSKPILLRDQRYAYLGRPFGTLGSIVGAQTNSPFSRLANPNTRVLGGLVSTFAAPARTGSAATTGAKAADSTSSVLSDPNLSIEEKLLLLMAKLSEYFDDELDKKLDKVSAHTSKQTGDTKASNSNLQTLQVEIQVLMQSRQQMFQTMSGILKSVHETSMSAIRNLKA